MILSVIHVSTTFSEIPLLKQHFIANLEEETREFGEAKLNDSIEAAINLKIEGFLDIINNEASDDRFRRDTNDLLLNEKGESSQVHKFHFISFKFVSPRVLQSNPNNSILIFDD